MSDSEKIMSATVWRINLEDQEKKYQPWQYDDVELYAAYRVSKAIEERDKKIAELQDAALTIQKNAPSISPAAWESKHQTFVWTHQAIVNYAAYCIYRATTEKDETIVKLIKMLKQATSVVS